MFERLGSVTYRFRFLIVVAWLAAAGWAVLYAPSLAAQGMTEQSAFLPQDAESVQAKAALERAFPGQTAATSATLSFSRDGGLTDADRDWIAEAAAWIESPEAPAALRDAVTGVATPESRPELASMLRSEDGELELMVVDLDVAMVGSGADAVVGALRDRLAAAPAGLVGHVTGSAGIGTDYLAAIIQGTDSTTVVTVALVVVILLLIYRAPLAAMVPLVTIGAAFLTSRGVLGLLAAAGWKVSSLLDTFVVVLVFGIGTDYAIFLISRYREEVGASDWHDASRQTVRRIGAVITASAATVVVGLGSMAFGEFGMIQTTGPALAVAVAVTLVAGLTLAPALLAIFGHYLFWPLHARTGSKGEPGGFFARLAAAVSRRPGMVTAVLLVALALPALAVGGMRTNFDVLAELPASSDARAGFDEVAMHLGRGKVVQATGIIEAPGADLLAPASLARLRDVTQRLVATPGVSGVTNLVSPDGDGVAPDGLRPSNQLETMADGFRTDDGTADVGSTGSGDPEAILDPDVSAGLAAAREYLAALGRAFPDVAGGTEFRAVDARLAKAEDHVANARDAAFVSNQLASVAAAVLSPTGAAGGSTDSIELIGDYLDELAVAYPEVRGLTAYDIAAAAVASLTREASIGAAIDLSSALDSLATHFEGRTDATLFPESLSNTSEARRLRAEVRATFDALPVDLEGLAAVFAARADDLFVPTGLSGETGADIEEAIAAFVSTDRSATRFYVTTVDDPYSPAAFETIRRSQAVLLDAAAGFGSTARAALGGATAELADVQTTLGRDFERVGLITVLGILVVLCLLLRSIVAPLYLVGTVLLSCATALGLSSWFFETILGQAGVSFYLPLLVFVLLVALGSDYNIFLMSRVREESEHRSIHDGIRVASGRTGAVITSAGLILAGTFGSMATAPLIVLFQVGVAVALGVLIDTFVVRSILVPAITTLAGNVAWWPSGGLVRRGRPAPVIITIPEPGELGVGRPRRRLLGAIALIAVVPTLIASLLGWWLANPTGNLGGLAAAVVNLDQGATVTRPSGDREHVDLGADLVRALTNSRDPATFAWVSSESVAAHAGLSNGGYVAVLTIPADFSSTIAAIRSQGGSTATAGPERATLRLKTNDATGYTVGTIARSISAAIAESTARTVIASYVDDVLVTVTAAHDQLAGAAGDAGDLEAGAADVVTRTGAVSSVAGQLVAGLRELADGTAAAESGADRLAAAVAKVADGTKELAKGTAGLSGGTASASVGARGVADGATSLADGLASLAAGVDELPAQATELATGVRGVADGASGVAGGGASLADALAQLHAGTTGLGDEAAALDAGAASVEAGVHGLASGLTETAAGAGALTAGAHDLSESVAGYAGAVASLASNCPALGGSEALCAQLGDLAATNGELTGGAAVLAGSAAVLAASTDALAGGAAATAEGAAALHDGTQQLAAEAPALEAGIASAASGAAELASGAAALAAGASAVADGTDVFAAAVPALATATSDAASGAQELAAGAAGLRAGLAKLARAADELDAGADAVRDGAVAVATATSAAASGTGQLAEGMTSALDAAGLIATGVERLAADGAAVAEDAADLVTGLDDAATSLPTYSDPERAALGSVVAGPVTLESTRLNAVATTGDGLLPYFMALALWLGAMAIYLVLPAILGRRGETVGWRGPLGGFVVGTGIGIVQAVVMVAVVRFGLGAEVARLPELFMFSILASAVFVAVNQGLVALLGYRGWLVALVLAVLQLTSAGAPYPVETTPAFFQALHVVLPMGYVVEAVEALMAGGAAAFGPGLVVLGAWLAGALVVTFAVRWHRPSGRTSRGLATA